MPRYYKKKRTNVRRVRQQAITLRGGYKAYPSGRKISRMTAPLPKKMFTKMRYSEVITINPSAGVCGVNVFSANGLYDPNITGVGHQPRGFDQLMALYDHFVCVGSKIRAEFVNTQTGGSECIVGVAVRDSTTVQTDSNEYLEGRKCNHRMLGQTNDGAEAKSVSQYFSPKKYLGISKPLASGELKGSVTANPTEQGYFHVFLEAIDDLVELGELHVLVTIDYLVALIEPKNPTQS